MGIFDLFSKGTADAVKGAVEGVGSGLGTLATDLRAAIKGPEVDPNRIQELAAEAERLKAQNAEAQARINETEARHASVFVAGWRPFIGWVCGFGFLYQVVFYPILHGWINHLEPLAPDSLYPVLFGILGLGLYRTYEKRSGVQDRH